jgi:hypothetical protein
MEHGQHVAHLVGQHLEGAQEDYVITVDEMPGF